MTGELNKDYIKEPSGKLMTSTEVLLSKIRGRIKPKEKELYNDFFDIIYRQDEKIQELQREIRMLKLTLNELEFKYKAGFGTL